MPEKDLRHYSRRIQPQFIPPVNLVMVSGAIVSFPELRKHPEKDSWDKCSFVLCNYQPVRNNEGKTEYRDNIFFVKCFGEMARIVADRRKKWHPVIVSGKITTFEKMDGRRDWHIVANRISLISTIMHKESFEDLVLDKNPHDLPDDAWYLI